MFVLNDDLSIYATRGDIVFFSVTAKDGEDAYKFKAGDVVRIKIFGKKNAENVVLQKDFPIFADTETVEIYLTKEDTKIGEVISKPTDYWYEIELNPDTEAQTIIGYDENGARVFKLFPEGADLEEYIPDKEDIPFVDEELDLTSKRPVQNQAIARKIISLKADYEETKKNLTTKAAVMEAATANTNQNLATLSNRLDILLAGGTADDAELIDIRVGYNGVRYTSAGEAVRSQVEPISKQVKVKNLIDFKKLTRGYIGSDGWIQNYNNGFSVANEVTTDFILVDPNEMYYFGNRFNPIATAIKESNAITSNHNWVGLALYDENKTFIKRHQYDDVEISLPPSTFSGATYVRASYRTYMFNRPVFAACSIPCEAICTETEADNLLETYPMIFNGYVTQTGAVIGTTHDINGYIPTEHNELTSDFIPCESNKEMFIYANASHDNFIRIAFYGADGYCISTFAYSPTSIDKVEVADYNNFLETFVTPENTVAMRISCRWTYLDECVLAYKDDKRRYLYKDCERKFESKYKAEAEVEEVTIPFNSTVKAVAHRGLSAYAPENTLSAYRLAAKHSFEYVECDISFTADDVPVLLHDNTINRTSNGTGYITKMTLAEARLYDFGSWFSNEYAGEKIPTAEEFIALCRRLSLHPYIEVKSGTEANIKGLVNIVRKYGMLRNVTWISFYADRLRYVKNADAYARLGYVVSSINADVVNTALELKTEVNDVFIDTGTVNDSISLCIENGIPVECWTVDSEEAILSLNPYISGVTSNYQHAGKVLYNAEI